VAKWFREAAPLKPEVDAKRCAAWPGCGPGPSRLVPDGNLITSRETFLRLRPGTPPGSTRWGS